MGKLIGVLGALIALAAIGFGIGIPVTWENTHNTQTCTVQSKDRTATSKGGSDVRIYTDQCGVLTIADDMFQGRWNSADVYSQIEAGRTYTFGTVGWRNGFLSQFPNIVVVK